ncbi:MAG: hypothetical protein AB7P21_19985 [Lautropia sp.]
MIARALRSAEHAVVTVLAHRPMASTHAGLRVTDLAGLDARSGPGAPDREPGTDGDRRALDLIVILQDPDAAHAVANRRDANFLAIATPTDALAVATLAARAGAARLLLLAPLAAWQQLSAASRLLPEGLEMALAASAIPVVVVFKPTAPPAPPGSPPRGRAIERFARFYLSQLRFMLPAGAQALRSTEIASLAFDAMCAHRSPGLFIVSPDTMNTR